VPLRESPSAAAADEEADVVAQDGSRDGGRDDPGERQAAELGQGRARQQDGLARNRDSGILQQDADEHDGVSVSREEIEQPFRHRNAPD